MKKLLFILVSLMMCAHAFAQIRVYDDAHCLVVLPQPAERIITLSPNANDVLRTIKSKHLIVGTIFENPANQQFRNIPKVGQYTDPDQEKIFLLQPDLIVMPRYGVSYGLFIQCAKLKIPIFVIDPKNISDIANDIKKLGLLVGKSNRAEEAATSFMHQVNLIKTQFSSKKKITVFYELWGKPLMTVGKQTLINQVINLCGGKNIFGRLKTAYPTISVASVIAANPQVIIVSDKRQIAAWNRWPMLQAVQKHQIFYVSSKLIQHNSPRILQGASMLCRQLHAFNRTKQ